MDRDAPRSLLPASGDVLAGKFEVVRALGEGGMAFVLEARDTKTGAHVALKVLAPEFARDTELVARFAREARAVGRLETPHVPRVFDVGETRDGLPFIAMELLRGRDLKAELEATGTLRVEDAVDYVLQACAAMHEAHGAGIVHRDLKPANLFLAKGEGEPMVKVLDFGISKVAGDGPKLTAAGAVMGTVIYMSPEQIRASANVDARADIWSLGVILYELVCGRAPFEGAPQSVAAAIVSEDAPDVRTFAPVPEGLAKILAHMLRRDVKQRPESVAEVVRALTPFARPGSVGARVSERWTGGGARQVTAVLPGPRQKTVPLLRGGWSATGGSSSPTPSVAPPPSSARTPALATPLAPNKRGGSGARTAIVVGAVAGLVAAAAFAWFFTRDRHPRDLPGGQPDRVAEADAESSAPNASFADAGAEPSATNETELDAASPDAESTSRPADAAAPTPPAHGRRAQAKDAGASLPNPPPAPTPRENPSHL